MATPANPLSSNIDSIMSLLNLFTGKKTTTTTSGGSSSEQTLVSKEGIDNLIRSLMEGNSGLAAVSSGQKAPGLYNSTTRSLMTNDLLARVGGQAAERSAVKVTNKDPITVTNKTAAPISPSTGIAGAAALFLGSKKTRDKLLQGLGIDDLLSLGIPLESGNSGSAVTSNAGQGVNFDFNNPATFPGGFSIPIDVGQSFGADTSFSAMSNAAFAPQEVAAAPEPAVTPEPMPEPAPPPVVEPVAPTPEPEPVLAPPPDVVAPPAPVTPPVVAPPAAPTPVGPPPVAPPVPQPPNVMSYAGKGISAFDAAVRAYQTQLAAYNTTYGFNYTYTYGARAPTLGAYSGPAGGTAYQSWANPTTDNLFQGNLGGTSGSGGTLSITP